MAIMRVGRALGAPCLRFAWVVIHCVVSWGGRGQESNDCSNDGRFRDGG